MVTKRDRERKNCSFFSQFIIFIRTGIKETNYANFFIADLSQAIELVPTNDFLRLFITVIRSWEERGLRPFKRAILFSITTENKVSTKLTWIA